MQDRYAGDVGDFAKYGLLRALSKGKRLGIAWYLHPDAGPVGDGRHTDYLRRCSEFRHLDCQLFDAMNQLVSGRDRSVRSVEQSGILQDAVFAGDRLEIKAIKIRDRCCWRRQWFDRLKKALAECNMVFADPDNGLFPDPCSKSSHKGFRPTRQESAKRIPLSEAAALAEGRTAVIYHHNGRQRGRHKEEIRFWMSRLADCSYAYYWRRWSNRTFFVLNPDDEIECRLLRFAERWHRCGCLLPREELLGGKKPSRPD